MTAGKPTEAQRAEAAEKERDEWKGHAVYWKEQYLNYMQAHPPRTDAEWMALEARAAAQPAHWRLQPGEVPCPNCKGEGIEPDAGTDMNPEPVCHVCGGDGVEP
jgi:hypothetical protein